MVNAKSYKCRVYAKYVYNQLIIHNYNMLFAANLRRTVEIAGVVPTLGCCYTIHCDGMEIRLSAAELG